MRINAINNTNFKGLFTNKSTSDNWKIEYSPYSWEQNNTSKMTPKKQFSIYSSTLPDNEEIFTLGTYPNFRDSSTDILGTESYFEDKTTGKIRKTITEVPAMNREDSLTVINKKLNKFLDIKNNEMSTISKSIENVKKSIQNSEERFNRFYNDSKEGYFNRNYSLATSRETMKEEFNNVRNNAVDLYNKLNNYKLLNDSSENVKKIISNNQSEIDLLKKLRSNNKLIDISKRDIYDPNKALWEALQNVRVALEKFVCLPHKTISVKEIMAAIGNPENNIVNKAIRYVDDLILRSI